MKNIFLLLIFIFSLIFTSFIKNNTRTIEKKIVTLDKEIRTLNLRLDDAELEYAYITTPGNLMILLSKYFNEDFTHYNKKNIKIFLEN